MKAGKIILTAIVSLTVLLALFIFSVYAGFFGHIAGRQELINYKNASASVVLSDDGKIIGRFFFENRLTVSYDQIPGHLKDALIATEDIRFYDHNGFDTRSFLRVITKTILFSDRSSGGGSTITQQLAKNMYGRRENGGAGLLVSKVREIITARRLEKIFSKEVILTLYLNTVSFGENIFGIETASQRFFSKSTSDLTIEESAVLVGMLKANTVYNPRMHPDNSLNRRNVVLRQMEKYKFLTTHVADSLCGLPLMLKYNRSESRGPADYFIIQVRNEAEQIINHINANSREEWDLYKDGVIITSTLNLSLQKCALEAFKEHMPQMQRRLEKQYQNATGRRMLEQFTLSELKRLGLEKRRGEKSLREIFSWEGSFADTLSVKDSLRKSLTVLHAGLIAVDPSTGAVRAWVGGIDFKTHPYDQVLARRQMASVFKPVIYCAALEEGMEPCYYLDNDSVSLSDFNDWSPENYDHSYGGKYSLSGALVHSMNVPTFSLFREIGFSKVEEMWKKLGFGFELDNTPSLSLGTAEANLKEVATAYSVFANGGFRIEPFTVLSIKSSDGTEIYKREPVAYLERVISERTSLLMNEMLQKAVREGTGISIKTLYGIEFPVAGKTGTSQDYSDAWFAAYNPGLVLVSRAGASTRYVHFNTGAYGSGSALALPLVARTLAMAAKNSELRNQYIMPFPELPPELADALDCPDFKEKSLFDKILDVFQKDKQTYKESEAEKIERRIRNIIRKIFRKK